MKSQNSGRLVSLNEEPTRDGAYVLYWMQASQRTRCNPALEHAVKCANELKLPLLVGFGLMDNYPDANERHYAFMLQGLADVKSGLAGRGIGFVIRHGSPAEVALELAQEAAMVVCDRGYLRHQKQWRDKVADEAGCRVEQVEGDVVVPVEEASDKAEFAARTLRPRIHRLLEEYLKPCASLKLAVRRQGWKLSSDIDLSDIASAVSKLKIDRSVKQVAHFHGGEMEAHRRLRNFLNKRLSGYLDGRNEPSGDVTSTLSPYLHFGQISPVEVALRVQASHAPAEDKEAFLEELIVRRELAMNFANYTPNYDSYDALPAWAQRTLKANTADKRPYVYARSELENAQTHDRFWNAAQRQMRVTGYMHNYMRMYWGKKVLEWKRTPREAYEDLIYLNNKYFLDGRDPASWANVGWIFGLHDRPWQQRPIFGTVRYMNEAGLQRKFDMEAYVRKIDALESD